MKCRRPMKIDNPRVYIGDGVYATLDGDRMDLITHDGCEVTNRIVLEPEVWQALLDYVDRMKAWRKEHKEG